MNIELDKIYNCDCLEGMSELPTGHKYEDTLDNGILAFVKLVEVKPGFKD